MRKIFHKPSIETSMAKKTSDSLDIKGVFGKVAVASPARPSTQAVASQRPVIMGHPLLFGCLAQQSLGAPSWCLDTTWEPGWQPNCHQPLKRDGVWRQARPPKHQDTSQYYTHKIKTNNLSHIFIYDFIITFIKSYNCSHYYNIISSSSQLQIASEKYLYHYK
jgi:hypothetical protein